MSTAADQSNACSNCGKGADDGVILKLCTACKTVRYCNRECQISHRKKHKHQCKRAASDLALFEDHPPREDCPICMLPFPFGTGSVHFKICCGKMICTGCHRAQAKEDLKSGKNLFDLNICPFCREDLPKSEKDRKERIMAQVEKGNPWECCLIAESYANGDMEMGVAKDMHKATEFYRKAGELGCSGGYFSLGIIYETEKNMRQAIHYYELAAMNGNVQARVHLADLEQRTGNIFRSTKHLLVAARAGDSESMDKIRMVCSDAACFRLGLLTRDAYEETCRLYQLKSDEMWSKERDEAKKMTDDEFRDKVAFEFISNLRF